MKLEREKRTSALGKRRARGMREWSALKRGEKKVEKRNSESKAAAPSCSRIFSVPIWFTYLYLYMGEASFLPSLLPPTLFRPLYTTPG